MFVLQIQTPREPNNRKLYILIDRVGGPDEKHEVRTYGSRLKYFPFELSLSQPKSILSHDNLVFKILQIKLEARLDAGTVRTPKGFVRNG